MNQYVKPLTKFDKAECNTIEDCLLHLESIMKVQYRVLNIQHTEMHVIKVSIQSCANQKHCITLILNKLVLADPKYISAVISDYHFNFIPLLLRRNELLYVL